VPLSAIGLLLAAAILHAAWNLLLKRAGATQIFTWWTLIAGAAIGSPALLLGPPVPGAAWPYIAASAVLEALYFVLLIRAYRTADFSIVYPLARGAAPALLLGWAALFLNETPRPAGLAGIGLLLAGLLLVGGTGWWRGRTGAGARGIAMALAVACCISLYSLVDGAAMRVIDAVPYTILITAGSALCITPFVLARYGIRAAIADGRRHWPRIIAVGLLTMLTYVLVLQAYSLARISYVGAVREISIVFGALAGWLWLNEPFGRARVAGSALIFAGILLIAQAG
jgi:drug/metabolite transporter (DMT)-like permease